MSGIIVIGQNEAARTTNDADISLCTVGLVGCIGVLLRSELGFTLIHVDGHTDLSFINSEMERLGSEATIQLFKWKGATGDLDVKIIDHLQDTGIKVAKKNLVALDVIKFSSTVTVPFGVLVVNASGIVNPPRETYIALCNAAGEDAKIDFGPQDMQLRSYKQQMFAYLNPGAARAPCVIYENGTWNDAAELTKSDAKLLNYLLEVVDNREKLQARIMLILKSERDEYKARFAEEYALYKKGSAQCLDVYNNRFPSLLQRVARYLGATRTKMDLPTPKAERKAAKPRPTS